MRDVLSHLIQILEDVEVGQNECRDLSDLYATKLDNRDANVLYVLTFVTIFITPIQLLSGIYGMNFVHIPELEWYSGYGYFWGLSVALMFLLALGFDKMGWFVLPWWLGGRRCRTCPSSHSNRKRRVPPLSPSVRSGIGTYSPKKALPPDQADTSL
jgi:hypothetical protein